MGSLWVSSAAAHVSVPDHGVSKGTDQEASLNVTRTSSGVKWLTIPKGKSVQGPPGSHHNPAAARKCCVWGPGDGCCPRSMGQTHPKHASRMDTRTSHLSRFTAVCRFPSSAQRMTFFKMCLRKKNEPTLRMYKCMLILLCQNIALSRLS